VAGVGSFLIFLAISETSPALVEAITGLRYVIIFLGAYGITKMHSDWLREDFSGPVLLGKTAATALVVAGLVVLGLNSEEESEVTQTPVIQVRNPGAATATASLLHLPPE
jgi:hypothetical protein